MSGVLYACMLHVYHIPLHMPDTHRDQQRVLYLLELEP